jgi:hypothetical protein
VRVKVDASEVESVMLTIGESQLAITLLADLGSGNADVVPDSRFARSRSRVMAPGRLRVDDAATSKERAW